jgi:hypothetical protein
MKPKEESRFFKGIPHPDKSKPDSFVVINLIEQDNLIEQRKFVAVQLIALVPDPGADWIQVVENLPQAENWQNAPASSKLAAEYTIIGKFNGAARKANKPLLGSFHLDQELSDDALLVLIANRSVDAGDFIDKMIAGSKSESFRELIGRLKKA